MATGESYCGVCVREEIMLLVKKVNISMHLLESAHQVLHVWWQCSFPHMYTVGDYTGVIIWRINL